MGIIELKGNVVFLFQISIDRVLPCQCIFYYYYYHIFLNNYFFFETLLDDETTRIIASGIIQESLTIILFSPYI